MKKVMLAVLALALGQTAFAAGVKVSEPWARPTVQGMDAGGAFMKLKNSGKKDDALIGGATLVAAKVEIHAHVKDGDVMRMREVKEGVPLPVGQEVMLKPGSYHVMLMGLKQPLAIGDKFPLTLKFKNSKPKTVTVKVDNMQAAPQAGAMAPMHDMSKHDMPMHDMKDMPKQ